MVRELKTYTLDEVAEILHITKRTLYTYIKGEKLKAVKFGKYWRVSQEDMEDFLAQGVPRRASHQKTHRQP